MPSRKHTQFFQAHNNEIEALAVRFSGYIVNTDEYAIRDWLSQFQDIHLDAALNLLQKVDYYDQRRVIREQRLLHQQLIDLNTEGRQIVYCPFGQAGKSGGELLHKYRLANHINVGDCIYQSQLSESTYLDRSDLLLAFIDDFVGTGDQVSGDWANIDGFINQDNEVYLCVLAGMEDGINHVQRDTRLKVISNKALHEQDKIFSQLNPAFSPQEKQILRGYCIQAGSEPMGYGNCQTGLVFYFRAPDNSISILRCNNRVWKGLFVRNP